MLKVKHWTCLKPINNINVSADLQISDVFVFTEGWYFETSRVESLAKILFDPIFEEFNGCFKTRAPGFCCATQQNFK